MLGIPSGDGGAVHAFGSAGLHHGASWAHGNAGGLGGLQKGRIDGAAAVGQGHLRAALSQGDGVGIGCIVVHREQGVLTALHRVALQVVTHGAGQHHTGAVVACEHQGALDGATGHDHGAKTHRAQALFGLAQGRVVATGGGEFDHAHGVAVVQTKRGAAVEHLNARRRAQLGQGGDAPLVPSAAGGLQQERATEVAVLLNQHDVKSCGGRRQSGAQTRWPTAHDQQVHVVVLGVVALFVGRFVGAADASGAADVFFKKHPSPRALEGPHEGLVIKASAEQGREPTVDGAPVPVHRGPSVLGEDLQARVCRDQCGGEVGFVLRTDAHAHERIAFFHPRAHDAARAVVFEGACDHAVARSQQGRGHGVAGKGGHRLPVVEKVGVLAALDAPTRGQAARSWAAHA